MSGDERFAAPVAPKVTRLRTNFPGYEWDAVEWLSQRTGLEPGVAVSQAVGLLMVQRHYLHGGQNPPPSDQMILTTKTLFPTVAETFAPLAGPPSKQWEWHDITVALPADCATYLNLRGTAPPIPNKDGSPRLDFEGKPAGPGFDATMMTLRASLMEAVELANRTLSSRLREAEVAARHEEMAVPAAEATQPAVMATPKRPAPPEPELDIW